MASSPASPASQVLSARERLVHIDIVRGFAVFGLLWSNLNAGFFQGQLSSPDVVAHWASTIFSGGKFWTLFSLLFGATLAMQMERADVAQEPLANRWLRRMLVLFGIGWAHALLVWPGDILRSYALAGTILILFRRLSNRVVLIAAVAMLSLGASRQSFSEIATRIARVDVQAVQRREQASPEQERVRRAYEDVYRNGSYLENVRARFRLQVSEWRRRASPPAGPLNWIDPSVLGLFLLGLVIGRAKMLQRPSEHHRALIVAIVAGFGVGIPLNVAVAVRLWVSHQGLFSMVHVLARLLLALGYIGGLLWLTTRPEWPRRLRWLAPVGRLGLTNYIAQTAFVTFVKQHWGLGLEPVLGWFACFALAIAFYVAQIAVSHWWVRHFTLGPVEWLWRRFTNGAPRHPRPSLAQAT